MFGDSISAGLANENTGWYTNETENGYMAFGPELARLLDAEWHVEARGGGSFFNDFWLPMVPWFDKTLGPKQLEHRPPADAQRWNFANFQPDVFVLALGTNDFSEQYPHIDEATYVDKYKTFLGQLRGYYPNAELFCLAPFKEGAPWDEARRDISLAVQALGDSHVHAVNPVGSTLADRWLTYPTDYVTGDEYRIARFAAFVLSPELGAQGRAWRVGRRQA